VSSSHIYHLLSSVTAEVEPTAEGYTAEPVAEHETANATSEVTSEVTAEGAAEEETAGGARKFATSLVWCNDGLVVSILGVDE